MNAKTFFAAASGASALVVFSSLISVGMLIYDINTIYDDIMGELQEFNVSCGQAQV